MCGGGERKSVSFESGERCVVGVGRRGGWFTHSMCPPCAHAEVKTTETAGPVLIHVITEKGRGYEPALISQVRGEGWRAVGEGERAHWMYPPGGV